MGVEGQQGKLPQRAIRRWGDTQKKDRITGTDMEKGQNNERNKRMGRDHN